MTSLVQIICHLITATDRATHELPRGLWLVYYPLAQDQLEQRGRLIAGRHHSTPSPNEQSTVRAALLEALDNHPTRVLVEMDDEWQEHSRNDWNGYALGWATLPASAAFSHEDALRYRVRLALEQREARIADRRRGLQKPRRPAADPGPEPLL